MNNVVQECGDVVTQFVNKTIEESTVGDKYAFAAGYLSSIVIRLLAEADENIRQDVINQLTAVIEIGESE